MDDKENKILSLLEDLGVSTENFIPEELETEEPEEVIVYGTKENE